MSKISVSSLQPGMRLARAVRTEGGMVLIAEGAELTAALIDRLVRMGLEEAHVEGAGGGGKSREELLAELDTRFRKSLSEPHMELLKRLMAERIEEAFSGHGNTGAARAD